MAALLGKFKVLEWGSCQVLTIPSDRDVMEAWVSGSRMETILRIHKTRVLKKHSPSPQTARCQELCKGEKRLNSYKRSLLNVDSTLDLKISMQPGRHRSLCQPGLISEPGKKT